jgi:vacuolar-type H+-ATPase subunit H
MPGEVKETTDKLDLLRSFPLDDSTEERVETLWRQLMVYKSFADGDLSEARARRAQAEVEREQAELGAVRMTQALCDRLRSEAERELEEARKVKLEALRARQDEGTELASARHAIAKAEEERERILAEAQKKSQEVLEQARAAALQETTALRRQAIKEIKTILTRVENMRAAVNEELETQRIQTNVAKLKATSRWLLAEAAHQEVEDPEGEATAALSEAGVNGGSANPELQNPPSEPRRKAAKEKSTSSKS